MSRLLAARRRGAFPANATLRVTDHAPIHYDSDSSLDEETRREQEDEEEQERELSKRHGEAAESGGGDASKKRDAAKTDKDIEAEYAAAAARATKKPRPTLTTSHLTGPQGLIRVRQEFPTQLRYPRCHSSNVRRDIDAAAAYSRQLVAAYQSFCYDLCPSFAFEDLLLKIDMLGSKKEVKSYLQQMRDDVRNAHVERLHGKEKAEKMIEELEMGLKQQNEILKEHFSQLDEMERPHDDDVDDVAQETSEIVSAPNVEAADAPPPVTRVQHVVTSNPYLIKAQQSRTSKASSNEQRRPPPLPTPPTNRHNDEDDDDDDEEEASFDDIQGGTSKSNQATDPPVELSELDVDSIPTPASLAPRQVLQQPSSTRHAEDASDDEEELETNFDDICAKPTLKSTTASPIKKNIASSSSRGYLKDSDDDDDDEGEEEADFGDVKGVDAKSGYQKALNSPSFPMPTSGDLFHENDEADEEATFDDTHAPTTSIDDGAKPFDKGNESEKSKVHVSSLSASAIDDADENLMRASQPSADETQTRSDEVDEISSRPLTPSRVLADDESLNRNPASSMEITCEGATQSTVIMECSEPLDAASTVDVPSNSANTCELPSTHPVISHTSCTPPSQDLSLAAAIPQPSQDTQMMAFAQESQEPSLMNESTQNTIRELATQSDEIACTSEPSQHPPLRERSLSAANEDVVVFSMDETATVIATQEDPSFTFPTQSQSQSNIEMMPYEHDKMATMAPANTTPTEMEES